MVLKLRSVGEKNDKGKGKEEKRWGRRKILRVN